METLPRDNGWKLMTTGGAAKAQVLDSCNAPLQLYLDSVFTHLFLLHYVPSYFSAQLHVYAWLSMKQQVVQLCSPFLSPAPINQHTVIKRVRSGLKWAECDHGHND